MAYQNRENLAYATVAVAPSPAASGTSLTVANGLGSLFPASNFSITVYPPGVDPLFSNAEICLVTSRTGDVFTIVRAQQGTNAKSIATGWQVANTITKLDFTLIQDSIIQSVVAGGVSVTAPAVVFSNSNGVSFGAAGSVITASVNTGSGGGMGSVNFSAGTTSNNVTDIVFSNSNGVSFGLNGSTITAQHNGLTSQSNQAFSAQGGSSAFQTLSFANSNGITFSNSNGSVVASHNGITQQSTQPVAASASNGSFLFSTLGFSNANNVTFGTSAGSIITASVNAAAGGSINFSAGTTSNNLTNIVFSNSNGVSFGLDGSTITASVGAGVAAGSISAGTTSVALGQVVFSNSNNVTFGLNGSTVTASAAGAAAGTISGFTVGTNILTVSYSNSNGVATMFPIFLNNALTFDNFNWKGSQAAAGNLTGTGSSTIEFGIFSRNVSTLSLITNISTTGTFAYSENISNRFAGMRNNSWTFAASSLSSGSYWCAFMVSRTNSSQALFPGIMMAKATPIAFSGIWGSSTTASQQQFLGLGVYNTAAPAVGIPASVAFTDISGLLSQYAIVPAVEMAFGTI